MFDSLYTQSVMCYSKQRIKIGLGFHKANQLQKKAVIGSSTIMHNSSGHQKISLEKWQITKQVCTFE